MENHLLSVEVPRQFALAASASALGILGQPLMVAPRVLALIEIKHQALEPGDRSVRLCLQSKSRMWSENQVQWFDKLNVEYEGLVHAFTSTVFSR